MNSLRLADRRILAVVFDLDGTLIHSTVDFRRMKERLVEEMVRRGVPPDLLNPQETIVNNLARVTGHLASTGREDEVPGILEMVTNMMNQTELEKVSETTPVEGAADCLERLRDQGLKIGLLTRGSREYTRAALRYSGLQFTFDAMVCRDDFPEEEAKPNGKAMVRMARMLGVEVEQCVLVGDHLIDLSCARSSSSLFVGVLSGSFGPPDWEANGCPLVVDDVSDLPSLLIADK